MTTKKKTALPRRHAPAVQIMPDIAALMAVLQAHALGEHEMAASQVSVALALLKLYGAKAPTADTTQAGSHEDALQHLS